MNSQTKFMAGITKISLTTVQTSDNKSLRTSLKSQKSIKNFTSTTSQISASNIFKENEVVGKVNFRLNQSNKSSGKLYFK